MKKAISVLALLFTAISIGQEFRENPEKPLSPRAGRVMVLDELLRISDEGKKFYFTFPRHLKIAPNGHIFVQDRDQLLRFDAEGRFLGNLFRNGQGPGEMEYLADFQLDDTAVIVYASGPPKAMWFDYEGRLMKEVAFRTKMQLRNFQFYHKGRYHFFYFDFGLAQGKGEVEEVPEQLFYVPDDGGKAVPLLSLATKYFVKKSGGGGGSIPVGRLLTAPWRHRYLAVSHTQEYLLKVFDAVSQDIVLSFRRRYRRIETPKDVDKRPSPKIGIDGRWYSAPPEKYLNDITKLMANGNHLWVVTSTTNEEKGILVDVYDPEGLFVDNFFVKFPRTGPAQTFGELEIAVSNDILVALEKDEEELFTIVKYRFTDRE